MPALLEHADIGRGWVADDVLDAHQVVLLVLDGLGYDQLRERAALAPTLSTMATTRITTVAPTTTSTALTSITTGSPPGEHGLVGYKVWVGGEVVNMLRWSSANGDASERIAPDDVQPITPFLGRAPTVISPREFRGSSFSMAHLREAHYAPYVRPSSLPVEVGAALRRGDRFVYAYYDGIDVIAHTTGLGEHYAAELAHVDRLVESVMAVLPAGAALVVTADHGQVQVGENIHHLDPGVLDKTEFVSGEARFVWLHGRAGSASELCAAAQEAHGHQAWVRSVDQVIDEGWFGRSVSGPARARLGDVAVVAHEAVAIVDPEATTPLLQSRHGSLTSAEMYVPLLTAVA